MFKPMAITVALALGGALAFSLTAFPALAAFVLPAPRRRHDGATGVWARLERRYHSALDQCMAHPQLVLASALLLLGGAVALGSRLGAEFVPRLDEGELSLDIKRLPSVSISEAQRLGTEVEQVLSRFPEVLSVVTRTGRAEVATDPVGPDETEVMVKLRPKDDWVTSARSGRPGRRDQARDRRRGSRDVRVCFSADRGPREPAAGGIARRRRHQDLRRRSRRR